MNSTIDFISVSSVSSTFSWGLSSFQPSQTITPILTSGEYEYVGYAPLVFVALSTTSTPRVSSFEITKSIDFGDYYNNDGNVCTEKTSNPTFFQHSYVMPGLYTIVYTENEVVLHQADILSFKPFQNLTWKGLGGDEQNCLGNSWEETMFQKPNQFTWKSSQDCIIPPTFANEIFWRWNDLSCNRKAPRLEKRNSGPITWNDAMCSESDELAFTWNEVVSAFCFDDPAPGEPIIVTRLSSTVPEISAFNGDTAKTAKIRVLEIPPVAYLSAAKTMGTESPITVHLTPRFVKAGSFPIEKIVWDFGDGSAPIERHRRQKSFASPFLYNGALSADPFDPRNFDVQHVYKKTSNTEDSFYPSITAYASSTGTTDCVSLCVGPITSKSIDSQEITLLQTQLTPNGIVYLGEFENTAFLLKS